MRLVVAIVRDYNNEVLIEHTTKEYQNKIMTKIEQELHLVSFGRKKTLEIVKSAFRSTFNEIKNETVKLPALGKGKE